MVRPLGLPPFCEDEGQIRNGYRQRLNLVRKYAIGEYGEIAKTLDPAQESVNVAHFFLL